MTTQNISDHDNSFLEQMNSLDRFPYVFLGPYRNEQQSNMNLPIIAIII